MGNNDPSPTAGESLAIPAPTQGLPDDVQTEAAVYLEEWRGRVNELTAARLRELADVSEILRDWVEETNRQLDRLGAELARVSRTGDAGSRSEDATVRAINGEGETSAADAAHLVAMQMAVRGASRQDVDDYLREVFEMKDTAGILDRAFAPE